MRDDIKAAACFVFVGCASEYSIGALYRRMCTSGFRCIEIDEAKGDAVSALKNAREAADFRVLLTSQRMHFGKGSRRGQRLSLPFLAALEAHALLEPHFSVAAPHDLIDQLYADEAPLLRAFDLYLAAAEEALCLSPYCRVEPVGWLKFDALDDVPAELNLRSRALWLVNYHVKLVRLLGIEGCADVIAQAAGGLCSLKFGAWHDLSELEDALQRRGQHIIPASTPFIQLMRNADWVICNAASSVIRECGMLGRQICLLLDEAVTMPEELDGLSRVLHEPNWRLVRSVREALTTEPGSSNTLRIERPDPPDRAIDALMRHIGPVFAKRNKRRLVVG